MELTFDNLLGTLKRFIFFIIIITVTTATIFTLCSKLFNSGNFQAEATLYCSANDINFNIVNIKSDKTLARLSEKINGKYSISTNNLESMIQVSNSERDSLIIVKVKNPDGNTAYWIAKNLIDIIIESTETFKNLLVINQPSIVPSDTSNIVQTTVIGGMIGLIFSILCAIIISTKIKTVYTRKDIESNLNINIISAISKNTHKQELEILSLYAMKRSFNKNSKVIAVADICNNYYNKRKIMRYLKKIININSDDAPTAQFLALAIAQKRKTVYVNAKDTKQNFYTQDAFDTKSTFSTKNLSVVNALDKNGDLQIEKTTRLLKTLREKFDCVIVDVSSINENSKALTIHNIVDGYILNVNAGNNNLTQINNALNALNKLEVDVHGIILANAKKSDVFVAEPC